MRPSVGGRTQFGPLTTQNSTPDFQSLKSKEFQIFQNVQITSTIQDLAKNVVGRNVYRNTLNNFHTHDESPPKRAHSRGSLQSLNAARRNLLRSASSNAVSSNAIHYNIFENQQKHLVTQEKRQSMVNQLVESRQLIPKSHVVDAETIAIKGRNLLASARHDPRRNRELNRAGVAAVKPLIEMQNQVDGGMSKVSSARADSKEVSFHLHKFEGLELPKGKDLGTANQSQARESKKRQKAA